jgi:hypothetical protein
MSDRAHARDAKALLREVLRGSDGVRGVGLVEHDGAWCVRVNVRDEAAGAVVPAAIDGVRVEVRVVGAVRPRR